MGLPPGSLYPRGSAYGFPSLFRNTRPSAGDPRPTQSRCTAFRPVRWIVTARGVEPLDSRGIVQGGGERCPEPLDRRRGKAAAPGLLEPAPGFRSLGDRVVADDVVELAEPPQVVRLHAAGLVHVKETGAGDR